MQPYTLQDVNKTVSFLKSLAEEMLKYISKSIDRNIDVGFITFFGDCSYDGHGILIDGKPYVFFDLNAIIPRLGFYNFRTFITHELLHAIHYYLNPNFYRANYQTVEERYFKLLFAEGIATHLSSVITSEKMEYAYCFGYISKKQVMEWIRNSEKMKSHIGNDINKAINRSTLDNSLYNRLFGIEDFSMLTSYRLGYYYGSEIIKWLLEYKNINDVLTLDYNQASKSIYRYFIK